MSAPRSLLSDLLSSTVKTVVLLAVLFAPLVIASMLLFSFYAVAYLAIVYFSVMFLAAPNMTVVCLPVAIFLAWRNTYSALLIERRMIDEKGDCEALWSVIAAPGASSYDFFQPSEFAITGVVNAGWDLSGGFLGDLTRRLGLPDRVVSLAEKGWTRIGAWLWARLVVFLTSTWFSKLSVPVLIFTIFHLGMKIVTFSTTKLLITLRMCLYIFVVMCFVPSSYYMTFVTSVFRLSIMMTGTDIDGKNMFVKWFYHRFTLFALHVTNVSMSVNSEFRRYHSNKIAGDSTRLMAHFKYFSISVVKIVDSLSLPSFIRNRMHVVPSREDLAKSAQKMADLGWPVNVNVTDAGPEPVGVSFKEWLLCGTDFKTGIHNMAPKIDEALQHMVLSHNVYKRTETYQNEANELEATSRYFVDANYNFPAGSLDDVWHVIGKIFDRSSLVPFNYIIKMWEKKYALGFFMKDPRGNRKYKRATFIKDYGGYGPFKELWRRTFYWASQIFPVAHISPKGESLPEKKWARDMIRTVTGSPITQYIMSTIWNYGPNHRFAWDSTPIKVGMPLNGYHMTDIWKRHARCQIHIEGDFTAFDSTLSGEVVKIIAEVRKRGYEHHKDREAIADLIDINYDQVSYQSLGFTSTGNVYRKGTGLTTGHSSTSTDNSIACVTLYLMAWRQLTGLSAREFLHFNELSVYGDDHILSVLQFRPAAWSPRNIRSTMARWGLTNNLEVKSLEDISFLSKFGRKARPVDIDNLRANGITDVAFIVWHDKKKLVGKLTGGVKSLDPSYRLKRLLSYLTLTAHHHDVYTGIVDTINSSKAMVAMLKNNKLHVPSYTSVVRAWYSPSSSKPWTGLGEEVEEFENTGKYYAYGSVSVADAVFGALSLVPDLINPAIFNYGYLRALQMYLSKYLIWVPDFISASNGALTSGHLVALINRSPYRWLNTLDLPQGVCQANKTTLMVRHWIFLAYCHLRKSMKFGAWANFLTRKVGDVQFLINGRMFSEGRQSEFEIDRMLICATLSFVDLPDWLSPIWSVTLPDVQLAVDFIFHFLLVTLWTSVPPNFSPLRQSISSHDFSTGPIVVEAPTGVGKSTGMIRFLSDTFGHVYERVIVIEPRSLLVSGLVDYMKSDYGMSVSGGTTGMTLDKRAKVYYMTPQSLMGHAELFSTQSLFVIDECHVDEPMYHLICHVLRSTRKPTIMTSATPTKSQQDLAGLYLPLSMATVFSREDRVIDIAPPEGAVQFTTPQALNLWKSKSLDFTNQLSQADKALVFVPTIAMAREMAQLSRHRAWPLTSEDEPPKGWPSGVYFSTPVADVGITIPGVNFVLTPNFTTFGEGGLLQMSEATWKQRRGRTGRTSNGVAIRYNFPVPFSPPPVTDPKSVGVLRQFVLDGVPPEFLLAINTRGVLDALGLPSTLNIEGKEPELRRVLSLFVKNLAPVFRGHIAAIESGDALFGPPLVLHQTGGGHISGSFPQDPAIMREQALQATAETINVALGGRPSIDGGGAVHYWSSVAGPVFEVRNLYNALINDPLDGSTDLANPKNKDTSEATPSFYEEAVALKDIITMLNGL